MDARDISLVSQLQRHRSAFSLRAIHRWSSKTLMLATSEIMDRHRLGKDIRR